jgi:hypothetical protein
MGSFDENSPPDGVIDASEMAAVWRRRVDLEEASLLGRHPLAFDGVWNAFCFGLATMVCGLIVGGWGEHQPE